MGGIPLPREYFFHLEKSQNLDPCLSGYFFPPGKIQLFTPGPLIHKIQPIRLYMIYINPGI